MSKVRVKTNFGYWINRNEAMRLAFQGQNGIRIKILNEVYYAVWVEYGTSKMEARAMVRRSIPAIVRFFESVWKWLPYPFMPEDIEELFGLVKDFALEEIRRNTPVRTGALRAGFEGEVEKY